MTLRCMFGRRPAVALDPRSVFEVSPHRIIIATAIAIAIAMINSSHSTTEIVIVIILVDRKGVARTGARSARDVIYLSLSLLSTPNSLSKIWLFSDPTLGKSCALTYRTKVSGPPNPWNKSWTANSWYENWVYCSGVHNGGFSKGGFSNNNITITHKLPNPPLLNPPL